MELIKIYLPWILSIITIHMTILAGNTHKNTWLLGLLNQALWLIWIIASESYGLIPMNLVLWVIYFRNHLKWSKTL